mgnify:FL=1
MNMKNPKRIFNKSNCIKWENYISVEHPNENNNLYYKNINYNNYKKYKNKEENSNRFEKILNKFKKIIKKQRKLDNENNKIHVIDSSNLYEDFRENLKDD